MKAVKNKWERTKSGNCDGVSRKKCDRNKRLGQHAVRSRFYLLPSPNPPPGLGLKNESQFPYGVCIAHYYWYHRKHLKIDMCPAASLMIIKMQRVQRRDLEIVILLVILLVILRVCVCIRRVFANILISKINKYAHETQRSAAGTLLRRRDCREGLAAFNHDNFARIATGNVRYGQGRFSVVVFSKGLRPISTIIRDNKL